ncbi:MULTISPECIES: membrane protein [Streptomyces]|uniref:Membrane protein n=1 Tax=Streptomyces fradiae ATCC 10745 = DSM 40063 TaxID=1319510 RepID=A0A1Y2NSS5_STRFR|nr:MULTISPECIES: membrane protein [Streptomyces]KAF0650589.1 membrane protein [Streptomyces fradiae ATCC 10745 = DSM 40063]OSY49998.1 hypothetical protein BG846_04362 [Streptomyces fradiae ATCC 10745 = DSM 40063]QEV12923.1 hypothetical protein CP974_13940 [Streptomyces fradiae ATCC 10745 = DSM 40063]
MPGKPRRALRAAALLAAVQTSAVLFASRAYAEPTPTAPSPGASPAPTSSPSNDNDCELIVGPTRDFCESDDPGSTSRSVNPLEPGDALDPLSSLARGCANAAAWTVDKLSEAVESTAAVDFTNPQFLKQYAVVFAASTILTLVLWLLAVAKRAIRGVALGTAISEAVGFLWLTVLASAFTPLILHTVVSATDGVTEVIASGTGGQTDAFFGSFSAALKKGDDIGGGPIMMIVVALVSILAAGILWLELVIRAALLYVGALLGTVVYAGLVDRNMWGHVRRWAGIMIAIILVKPVIVIVLGLAGALSSGDGPDAFSAVVSGLAIILLAIFASAAIYRFVPGFGDEIATARTNRKQATDGAQAAAVISSPAALVSQGIKTHSSRSHQHSGGGAPAGAGAGAVAGGVAAHSSRGSAPTGPAPGATATPAPRSAPSAPSTTGSPHTSRGTGNTGNNSNNSSGGGGR